jgi:hypothetical protein
VLGGKREYDTTLEQVWRENQNRKFHRTGSECGGEMARPNVSSSADVTSAYRLPTAEKYVGVTKNLNVAGTKPVSITSVS